MKSSVYYFTRLQWVFIRSCLRVKIDRILPYNYICSAHIYHSHYQTYRDLELAQYLNMMTLHMVLFVEQFGLIEEKELTVLADLIQALKRFKGLCVEKRSLTQFRPMATFS